METPKVIKCEASECAYNKDEQCHAMAITVGGPVDHKCDTFVRSPTKGGVPEMAGLVGACKVTSCRHNKSLGCSASGVTIGHEQNEVDCLTFTAR